MKNIFFSFQNYDATTFSLPPGNMNNTLPYLPMPGMLVRLINKELPDHITLASNPCRLVVDRRGEYREIVVFRNDSLQIARKSRLLPFPEGTIVEDILIKHSEWILSQVETSYF